VRHSVAELLANMGPKHTDQTPIIQMREVVVG
jgi:hypothetical protein